MEYVIDCRTIHSREEFHQILAETLHFPAHYGHNLDALHDVLTAITTDTHLILLKWDSLSPAFRGFKAVMDDAEEYNDHLNIKYR